MRAVGQSDICDGRPRPDLLAKMRSLDAAAPKADELAVGGVTKLRYLQFREGLTTTQALGFRIDAMRVGDDPRLSDPPLNFRRGPREPDAVLAELSRFVRGSREVAAALAARLRALRAALEGDEAFFPRRCMLRSSLLFTYDLAALRTAPEAAGAERPPHAASVHMIDFSATSPSAERLSHRARWAPGNGEDGYLLGVDNLIMMFDKVERGEASWG